MAGDDHTAVYKALSGCFLGRNVERKALAELTLNLAFRQGPQASDGRPWNGMTNSAPIGIAHSESGLTEA